MGPELILVPGAPAWLPTALMAASIIDYYIMDWKLDSMRIIVQKFHASMNCYNLRLLHRVQGRIQRGPGARPPSNQNMFDY